LDLRTRKKGELPRLAGTCRRQPDRRPCQSGRTFTVTQTANMLDLKDEHGIIGSNTLSSNISVSAGPPWNMLGTIFV
jgi:hypothetical protein